MSTQPLCLRISSHLSLYRMNNIILPYYDSASLMTDAWYYCIVQVLTLTKLSESSNCCK